MAKVIKRDKRKQQFSRTKLEKSIEKAAKEAKISAARIKTIVKEISEGVYAHVRKKKLVKSTDLRRYVLGRLERRSKAATAAWRRFDRKRR